MRAQARTVARLALLRFGATLEFPTWEVLSFHFTPPTTLLAFAELGGHTYSCQRRRIARRS